MRTVTFKSVLSGVATRMGLEPAANLQANQAAALTEYIVDRLQKYWELAAWPEWTTSEQRQFRGNWDSAVTYAMGAEVYYAAQNAYYRSLQDANTAHAPTDTAWWTPATDLRTYIAFAQSWEPNEIGAVWGVWLDDPRTVDRPRPAAWWIGPEGIWVQGNYTKVYVEFGFPPPSFSSEAWDPALAYVAGDLVYYGTTGECYEALAASTGVTPTTSSSWSKQDFPKILARAVKLAAIADSLREDENIGKASAWDAQAGDAFGDAMEQALPAMRNQPSFQVQR